MDFKVFRQEVEDCLRSNILRFWIDKMQDTEHGGFYGQMLADGTLVPTADKGAILNGRLLWTFSAAYRVLGDAVYLQMADRARDYICQHFLDCTYGGCYWSVDYLGRPKDTKKQFYAIGFLLYGFSEHYRATGDASSLALCRDIFHCIEQHGWESTYGGYIEATGRDWSPIADVRLSEYDKNYPHSQNTHLHIIEPYTNLLKALRQTNADPTLQREVEASVRRLIDIFLFRILNPETHHLDVFFNLDWSRPEEVVESYGHDIEVSWLLHEAAYTVGDKSLLERVEKVVVAVARASEKGLRPDGSMIHEANITTGRTDDDLQWWVMAEAVVGFFNVGRYDIVQRLWEYIKQNLIDYEGGEWWWSRYPDGRINTTKDKAGFWKCPYHNGRMCLEIIERLDNSNLKTP